MVLRTGQLGNTEGKVPEAVNSLRNTPSLHSSAYPTHRLIAVQDLFINTSPSPLANSESSMIKSKRQIPEDASRSHTVGKALGCDWYKGVVTGAKEQD